MNRSILPNLLSVARIACAPAAVAMAANGSRFYFEVFLGAMFASDMLDGFLARKLNAQSDLGRKLDGIGDYTTMIAAAIGIVLLWPGFVQAEWPWIAVGLAGYFAIVIYGLVRWRRVLSFHTWASKGIAVLLVASLAWLLIDDASWPLRLACGLQVVAGIEELAIAFTLPGFSGEVPTLWHARRRAAAMALTPAHETVTSESR